MFPDNRLSTILVADQYTYPYTLTPPNNRTAYALGGIALSDPSQGLQVQLWTAVADAEKVTLSAPNLAEPLLLLPEPNVTNLTLAFDQNMNFSLAYMQYGTARLHWFDTFVDEYVTTSFAGASTPRVTLDDKRELQSTNSDLILAYVLNNNLYFRLQRERFLNERLLQENVNAKLVQMGMNVKNRLQFRLQPQRSRVNG